MEKYYPLCNLPEIMMVKAGKNAQLQAHALLLRTISSIEFTGNADVENLIAFVKSSTRRLQRMRDGGENDSTE